MRVAVLCARRDSVYKSMPGCEVYDEDRDCRTFAGGIPVIAHPPCRGWGRLRQFSNHSEAELELGRFCVRAVQHNCGVLEHPATSALWADMGLPRPGSRDNRGGWTLDISQRWFGHRAVKRTWLYIVGVAPAHLPPLPYSLAPADQPVQSLSRRAREATPVMLAEWLVQVALSSASWDYGRQLEIVQAQGFSPGT